MRWSVFVVQADEASEGYVKRPLAMNTWGFRGWRGG
jgi:hypothetical protein